MDRGGIFKALVRSCLEPQLHQPCLNTQPKIILSAFCGLKNLPKMFKLLVLMSVLALSYGRPQFISFLPQFQGAGGFQGGAQPLTFSFPFVAPPTTTAAPTTTLPPTTVAPVLAPAPAAPAPAQLFFPFHQLFPQAAAAQPITYSFNTGK